MVPVTIVEIPAMVVTGIRLYRTDTYGKRAYAEASSEEGLATLREVVASGKVTDVFAITKTQVTGLTGVPKKTGDTMEMRVAGGSLMSGLSMQYHFSALKSSLILFSKQASTSMLLRLRPEREQMVR